MFKAVAVFWLCVTQLSFSIDSHNWLRARHFALKPGRYLSHAFNTNHHALQFLSFPTFPFPLALRWVSLDKRQSIQVEYTSIAIGLG
jgi:hypothetical protein